jgi:hypothetical protein
VADAEDGMGYNQDQSAGCLSAGADNGTQPTQLSLSTQTSLMSQLSLSSSHLLSQTESETNHSFDYDRDIFNTAEEGQEEEEEGAMALRGVAFGDDGIDEELDIAAAEAQADLLLGEVDNDVGEEDEVEVENEEVTDNRNAPLRRADSGLSTTSSNTSSNTSSSSEGSVPELADSEQITCVTTASTSSAAIF